jgi:hypothetical protein
MAGVPYGKPFTPGDHAPPGHAHAHAHDPLADYAKQGPFEQLAAWALTDGAMQDKLWMLVYIVVGFALYRLVKACCSRGPRQKNKQS